MVRLVKARKGYYKLKTKLELNEVQARMLDEYLIPEHSPFAITYTGRVLTVGFIDGVGHQYSLSLNLKDGSVVIKEDFGAVRYTITHYADGRSEVEEEVGYDGTR
jgi:hypothetical protein